MGKWVREPLLHFAALGAALFVLYELIGTEQGPPDQIVVSARTIEGLVEGFGRVWERPPTKSELDALIEEQIKEEVYYREAVKAGLDRDDSIIRRRLRQKMEFLAEEPGRQPQPPELAGGDEAARQQMRERKQRAIDELYAKLRAEYTVRIEAVPDGIVLQAARDGR